MNVFGMEDLKELAGVEEDLCFSLYMSTDPEAATADEDRIRFKNLLRRAEKRIEAEGAKNDRAWRETIEEGYRRLRNDLFWRHQSNGLAVFAAPGFFRDYRLPLSFGERFTAAGRFHLKPLLPLFMADGRFHVLALSQNEVRLFDCSRDRVMPVDLGEVSRGLAETLDYDTKQYQLQFHTRAADGGGRRSAVFHGHGVGNDDDKDEIRRYFRKVDRALQDGPRPDEAVPLVLAGVDAVLALFREVTTHPRIMDETVSGNPEELKAEELHRRAWEIIRPELERAERQDRGRYRQMAGKGYTAAGVRAVVPAAAYGKIDTLFVALDRRAPGAFDRERNEVTLHGPESAEGEDLFDRAAVDTIRHGGRVYAVPEERVPARDAAAAAILRY